jgi:hypothetical protein
MMSHKRKRETHDNKRNNRKNKRNQKTKMQAHMELALLNIEGQANKLSELQTVLEQIENKIQLLAVTETKENYYSLDIPTLSGFMYFGKPIEYDLLTSTPQGGVGFWVDDSISNRASVFIPKVNNENILWLQIHGKLITCYFCVTYSRPGHPINHDQIIDTLILNQREITLLGPITILGDFNAHVTDKTESQLKKGPQRYDRALLNLLKTSGLTPLRATDDDVTNNIHWTYHGYNKSKSVNDYILTQKHNTSPTLYRVHQDIDIGSTHRLITARIEFQQQENTWSWGEREFYKTEWNNHTVSEYQKTIKSIVMKSPMVIRDESQVHEQIVQIAEYISSTTTSAMTRLTEPSKTKTRSSHYQKSNKVTKPNSRISTLLQNKRALLKKLTRVKHKNRSDIITEINKIQKDIRYHSQQVHIDDNKHWWDELNKLQTNSPDTIRQFWKLAKKLNPTQKHPMPTMFKTDEDKPLTGKQDILEHIKNYYISISTDSDKAALEELENQNISPEALSDRNKSQTDDFRKLLNTIRKETETQVTPDEPPSEEEIESGIDGLKTNKTPGYDHITAEMIKYAPPCMRELIYKAINMMWNESITPGKWNIAITTLLFKKGDRHRITNYRPITLLCTLFKLWEKILDKRVREIVVNLIPPIQMGSLKNNSAALATITKKLLILKAKRENRSVFSIQVDMNKAYNRIKRKPLWTKLHKLGIKGLLLKAVMSTYDSATERITIGSCPSGNFTLENGLRQGSILSPILYLVDNIDLITELINSNTGIQTGDVSLQDTPGIMFVDDLNTLTDGIKNLEHQFQIINKNSWTCGGIVNYGKSTVASTLEFEEFSSLVSKTGIGLKPTDSYIHLGNKYALSHNPTDITVSMGVKHRLSKASTVLNTMIAKGMNNLNLCPTNTTHITTITILVTLTYGLTYQELTGTDKQALKRLLGRGIKNIYNITKSEYPDDWLILEANIPNPTDLIIFNDIATIIKCKEKGTNPLCRAVINNDKHFIDTVTKNCLRWKTSMTHIEPLPKNKRRKFLISKAKQYRLSHYKNNYEVRTLTQMGNYLKNTAYERVNINPSLAGILMKARAILHHHDTKCEIICPYCKYNELHTITHIITRCEFQLTEQSRDQCNTQLTSKGIYTEQINKLNIRKITSAMGGPLLPEWSEKTRTHITRACLLVLHTSPLLFPPFFAH